MSHRLQVLIPQELDAQLEKAAQRSRVSKGEWVRRALRDAIQTSTRAKGGSDPLERLKSLNGPTADIRQMLSEIEAGRR
jgi:metal-responsive CopG/Arc/MetJ family transcriptional regulator